MKLHVRALCPGWGNHVKYARISIIYAVGINEDDEFQNLQDGGDYRRSATLRGVT